MQSVRCGSQILHSAKFFMDRKILPRIYFKNKISINIRGGEAVADNTDRKKLIACAAERKICERSERIEFHKS